MGEINYAPLIDDMVWSYSRIKAFVDCPYRFYLKYIRHIHGKEMFFASYGTFIEDTKANTIVTFCLYCGIVGHEAVWIIAFDSKPGNRLIRNFCFPSVSFFIPPTAEQTVFS